MFANFAHTGSTAVIDFFIFGPGNQSLDDESWAMDNLQVSVTTLAQQPPVTGVPEPMTLSLLGAGLAGIGLARRRRA